MTKLEPVADIPVYALIIRATHETGKVRHEAIYELNARGAWLSDNQIEQAGLTRDQYRQAATNSPDMAQAFGTEDYWEYIRANIGAAKLVELLAAKGLEISEMEIRESRMHDEPATARHVCGYSVALRQPC